MPSVRFVCGAEAVTDVAVWLPAGAERLSMAQLASTVRLHYTVDDDMPSRAERVTNVHWWCIQSGR